MHVVQLCAILPVDCFQKIGVCVERLCPANSITSPWTLILIEPGLMSSFHLFYSLETSAIFRNQYIPAVGIPFSSCFRAVQHSDSCICKRVVLAISRFDISASGIGFELNTWLLRPGLVESTFCAQMRSEEPMAIVGL